MSMKMADQTTCRRCSRDKNAVKMFSNENNMNPGPVPDELKDISIEQQLICRIAPAIHVHMLKHGGIAANGHCVTFPQNVNQPALILPKLPQEVNIIKVRKVGSNDKNKEFRVRRYSVQSALEWLKNKSAAYSDLIISQERLDQLPCDSDINLPNLDVNDVGKDNVLIKSSLTLKMLRGTLILVFCCLSQY